ncbi:hypothetical protein VCV18_011881 [Metarhizium anisopliae]
MVQAEQNRSNIHYNQRTEATQSDGLDEATTTSNETANMAHKVIEATMVKYYFHAAQVPRSEARTM